MRTENTAFPTRLLRVREFPGPVAKQPGKKGKANRKSRFVAPYYLQEEEQAAIAAALEQEQLGDEEGRQLFITAAEYEVGSYHLAPKVEPARAPAVTPKPKSKSEIELEELGRSAEQLLALLVGTHKTARKALLEQLTESDTFGREHGERYLGQLELELGRVAEACRREEHVQEEPALDENAQRLIAQLARIYGECLEVSLDPEHLETFGQILCIIRDSAKIAIPCDPDTLAGVVRNTL